MIYIATKNDGIRVSEMQKIAFISIEEGEIDSAAMYIEAISSNSGLMVKYMIKNSRAVVLEATKNEYSYDEIRKIIMREIVTYGSPYHGAALEYENGDVVDEEDVLVIGAYRMMCYLPTADGLAQSYIYLTIE